MSIRLLRGSLKWIWILTGNSPQPRRVKWKGGSLRTDAFTKSHITSLQHKSGRKKTLQNFTTHPLWVPTQLMSLNQSLRGLAHSLSLKLLTASIWKGARVCVHVYHMAIQVDPISGVWFYFPLHPSICIQAMSKSQQGGINARVSQEEHMSVCYGKVRGIFAETSKRQQFRRRTADWLKRSFIQKPLAVLNLSPLLRGSKISHLTGKPLGPKFLGFQNKYQ